MESAGIQPFFFSAEIWLALAILLLPLLSFIIVLPFGRRMHRRGDWLAISLTSLSFLLSVFLTFLVWPKAEVHSQFSWFSLAGSGNLPATKFLAGFYLDKLAVLMLVLVTFISVLVQLFSIAYMKGDRHYNRYFAFLGLFTFSMLGIVLADNLLIIFLFWELVGFSSYLLIGFWFAKDPATKASMKAFLINRVGDIGLLLGLFMLFAVFRTFDLQTLQNIIQSGQFFQGSFQFSLPFGDASPTVTVSNFWLTIAGLGLFCGCVGKSAQFPLQVWLPDAMAGPTPVSALIHAATMVAAGVYLLARCFVFFTPDALFIITIIGAVTALLGAIAACYQFDIKKILAFSTISQLGYMVMGMGVGAYEASVFHLFTHAFFKAALFLNAGIVIHSMHHALHHPAYYKKDLDPQDIRNLGGLRKVLPVTFYSYILAGAGLVGLPLTAGFLSKDAIIAGSCEWAATLTANGNFLAYLIPIIAFITVLLTAYYVGRQFFYLFFGRFRAGFKLKEIRLSPKLEAPLIMLIPVILLSLLSLGIFFSINPFDYNSSWFLHQIDASILKPEQQFLSQNLAQALQKTAETNHFIHLATAFGTILLGILGLFIAWKAYKKKKWKRYVMARKGELPFPEFGFPKFAHQHFYLDKVYQTLFISPGLKVSEGSANFDRKAIDNSLNFAGKSVVILAKITGWFDRIFIDGLVNFAARLAGLVGKLGRILQGGSLQRYYIYALLGLILLVGLILIF